MQDFLTVTTELCKSICVPPKASSALRAVWSFAGTGSEFVPRAALSLFAQFVLELLVLEPNGVLVCVCMRGSPGRGEPKELSLWG